MLSLTLLLAPLVAAPGDGPTAHPLLYVWIRVSDEEALKKFSGGRYIISLEREKVEAVLRGASHRRGGADARLVSGRYSARLEGDDLVGGEARLRFVGAESATIVPLVPWGLATGNPRWAGRSGPAKFGLHASGDAAVEVPAAAGPTATVVGAMDEAPGADEGRAAGESQETPGANAAADAAQAADEADDAEHHELLIPWSLRGERTTSRARGASRDKTPPLVFRLRFPSCLSTVFTLDLPLLVSLETSRGVARMIDAPPAEGDPSALDPSEFVRRWEVDLGGASDTTLTLVPTVADLRPPSSFRQTTYYRFSPLGVELQTDLTLPGGPQDRPDSLDVVIRNDLQLIGATVGDAPLEIVSARPDHVSVRLPEDRERELVVRLLGFAPASGPGLWTLPDFQIENLVWEEGEGVLLLPETLELLRLETEGSRQMAREPWEVGLTALRLRHSVAAPVVRVEWRLREPRLTATTVTIVGWTEDNVTVRTVSELGAEWGEQFDLRLSVPDSGPRPDRWVIDAVETTPPNQIDVAGLSRQAEGGVLSVPLRRPVSPGTPLRLEVRAHRRRPDPRRPLDGPSLLVGQPVGCRQLANFLSVQGEVVGDGGLRRVDPQGRSGVVSLLPSGTSTYEIGPGLERLRLRAPESRVTYSAEIHVDAEVREGLLDEHYRIRCVPDEQAVSTLRVLISGSRTEPIHWTIPDGRGGGLSATRMPVEGGTDEQWELALDKPRERPFMIEGRRTSPLDQTVTVALASLPEALSQTGIAAIRSAPAMPLTMHETPLKALPTPPRAAGETPLLRGLYRYEPSRPEALTLSVAPPDTRSLAWCWLATVESRFGASGHGQHTAEFLLENLGRDKVRLEVPQELQLVSIECDGVKHEPPLGAASFTIPLPVGRRTLLRVRYTTRGPSLASAPWGEVRTPLVSLDIPVLRSRLRLLLPPGYESTSESAAGGTLMGSRAGGTAGTASARGDTWLGPFRHWFGGGALDAAHATRWNERIEERAAALRPLGGTWGELLGGDWSRGEWSGTETSGGTNGTAASGTAASDDPEGTWPLLLDPAALDRHQIRPDGALPAADPGRLLGEQGLRLVESTGWTILTDDLGGVGLRPLIDRAEWSAGAPHPWPSSGHVESPPTTWAAKVRSLTPDEVAGRHVREAYLQRSAVEAWSWAALLVGAGLVPLLRLRRLALPVLALGLLGSSWLAPAQGAMLAGLAWGVALGSLLMFVWPTVRARGLAAAPLAPALLVLSWLTWDTAARCLADPDDTASEIHLLLVLEDKVYFTESFRRAFKDLESTLRAGRREWLMASADYTLDISDAEQPIALTASYTVEVSSPQTRVRLPAYRAELKEPPRLFVDGAPATYEREESGDGLVWAAPAAGAYQLRLELAPVVVESESGERRLRVSIPPVPQSRVRIEPGATTLGDSSLIGRWTTDLLDGRLLGELGPATHWELAWRDSPAPPRTPVRFEQLSWLRLQSNSTMLEARVTFHAGQPLSRVRLFADPRLRPLSWTVAGREAAAQRAGTTPTGEQILELPIDPPAADVQVVGSFHVTDYAGVGRSRPPCLDVEADQCVARWLALSLEAPLELSSPQGADLGPLSVEEFLITWGGPDTPDAAFRLPSQQSPDDDVRLSIRQLETQGKVRQRLDVVAAAQSTRVDYQALVKLSPGPCFELLFRTPSALRLDTIRAVSAGRDVLAGTSRDRDGDLTLFLDGASDDVEVWLEGIQPQAGDRAIPWLAPRSLAVESTRLRVYRDEGLSQVVVRAPAGIAAPSGPAADATGGGVAGAADRAPGASLEDLADDDIATAGAADERGRLVWEVESDQDLRGITLETRPNRLDASAELVTTLSRPAGDWIAELSARVEIRRGLVDTLRFEIPAEWREPLHVVPEMRHEVRPVPGTPGRRLLLLYPDKGEAPRELRVRVRGSLASPADGVRRAAPDIVLRDLPEVSRYLALPRQAGEQQIEWVTTGLQAAELPASLAAGLAAGPVESYLQVGRHFDATVRRVERVAGSARVRLADIRVQWTSGTCQGVVIFDVEPAGRSSCDLRLPEGGEAIQVLLDGRPASIEWRDVRTLRVTLGPDQLPQRIAIVYESPGVEEHGHLRLLAPVVHGMPTLRTLWTIRGPAGRTLQLVDRQSAKGAGQLELLRLEAWHGALDLASDLIAESDREEIADWFTPWAQRMVGSERRLLRRGSTPTLLEAAEELRGQRRLLAEKLRMPTEPPDIDAGAVEVGAVWDETRVDNARSVRASRDRDSAELELLVAPPAPTRSPWLLAFVLLAAFALQLSTPWRNGARGEANRQDANQSASDPAP